jgi:NitT/TauT family transport system permease protein
VPESVLEQTAASGASLPDPLPSGSAPVSKRGRTPSRWRGLALNIVSAVLGIAIWWGFAAGGYNLPTPPEVASRFVDLIKDGTLQEDVVASLRRVLIGFALGVAAAIPVGFLMGWYPIARGLLEPWVQFFRTIPPLALIPLTIVLMGIDETRRSS